MKQPQDIPKCVSPRPFEKTIPTKQLPQELRIFAGKSTTEILQAAFPPKSAESYAGIVSGLGLDVGLQIPPFAREASKQFWKYHLGSGFDLNNSLQDFGCLTKILEVLSAVGAPKKTSSLEASVYKAMPGIKRLMEKEVATMSDADKAEFYSGRAQGEGVVDKLDPKYLSTLKRAELYFAISACWRKLEEFPSLGAAERWLRSEELIGQKLTSAEVRAVAKLVGLSYRGPGRPRKIAPKKPNS